jgi:hypothetical protein
VPLPGEFPTPRNLSVSVFGLSDRLAREQASLTGGFSHIKNRVFDSGLLQWSVIYQDNHAILTVEQHMPDQGSTFLLLTLSLLALLTCQRKTGYANNFWHKKLPFTTRFNVHGVG